MVIIGRKDLVDESYQSKSMLLLQDCESRLPDSAGSRVRAAWGRLTNMANYPRNPEATVDELSNWDSEFGFGAGHFPDPAIDYSGAGSISRIPIADPDRTAQIRTLAEWRRTDLGNAAEPASPYVLGNTDRFGAQPPLVRERRVPKRPRRAPEPIHKMERGW